MSGPFGSSQWMYSSGGFYPTEIEQSLRFNDDDSAYLSWTPASAGNRKTWTWSGWVKRCRLTSPDQGLFEGNLNFDGSNYFTGIRLQANGTISANDIAQGSYNLVWTTSAVYRDTAAWYHIVVSYDTTQASSSDAVNIYVNGVQQDINFSAFVGSYSQNRDSYVNATNPHSIGTADAANYFDGYLAEVNFIDGQALDPTDFGEFKSGVWVAKSYAGSYGTNGFYLNFSDSANIGDDLSGNANDWTANNLVATDVVLDSPTQNWCVLNPLAATTTLAEGNLRSEGSGSISADANATMGSYSNKWYFETYVVDQNAVGNKIGLNGEHVSNQINYRADGQKTLGGSTSAYGATWTNGDIIGCAFDVDTTTIEFYKNGVSQGSFDYSSSLSSTDGYVWPYVIDGSASNSLVVVANFGQDSSFAGNKTAQGNTDDNGVGDFFYAPPSGYLALCTANLPDPVIDPAQDDVPSDYFNTVLYTGDGTSSNAITGVGFEPDWTWIKRRSGVATNHILTDAVRGATQTLISNATDAESTEVNDLTSFDADGFTVGSNVRVNQSGGSFVSWNWLAGNGTSSNTDGSITSTVSVNQKAGFSVISWAGNSVDNATLGHGLSVKPSIVICKARDKVEDWQVWNDDGLFTRLRLNATAGDEGNFGVSMSSSVITLPVWNGAWSQSGYNYIAYCFAEVEGYSKFGSYTGNGSTDGPFVYCGFRPAFVIFKATNNASSWVMQDNTRDTYNPTDKNLYANLSNAEDTGDRLVDFLSNGFKPRLGTYDPNKSGYNYIFMAFADQPAKYSNAR